MDDERRLTLLQLSRPLTKSNWPLFKCVSCKIGAQKLVKIEATESTESSKTHKHEDWEPEWISGNFKAETNCHSCKQIVYIVGIYNLREYYPDYDPVAQITDPDYHHGPEYEDVHEIKYMVPAIELLRLPKKCPDNIKSYIESAAEVIFCSPGLAANKLRSSIDALLTAEKIPRYRINKKSKRERLTTHDRIVMYRRKNADVGNLLEAVKWIGNGGSHESKLSFDDVVSGLEIYGLALNLLYENSTAAIRKKASLINKNKGIKK